ncbi:MAG: hypothetical protein JSW55_07455 [Chloroflexota bacterium]|nr:MAG: hypothetical protein JSW55_07455 [Chloroflexota bacterium]
MKQHVNVVAALQIGFGVFKILIAAVLFLIMIGAGLVSGDAEALAIVTVVGLLIAGFLALTALPAIVGGVGLLKGKNWARVLVIFLAVLDLIDFPIGTAIGAYTLWVLLNNETSELFDGGSKFAAQPAFS